MPLLFKALISNINPFCFHTVTANNCSFHLLEEKTEKENLGVYPSSYGKVRNKIRI